MTKISNNKLIRIYILGAFFILAFVERNAGSVPLQVFHIEYNKGYILLCFTILMLVVLSCFRTNKRMDLVAGLLFIRCIWDIIPFFRDSSIGTSMFWYYYSMVLAMPIIYIVFLRYTGSLKRIINYLTAFGILLIIQLCITAILNGYSFSDSLFKDYMRIPFAHSNINGAILLAILFLRILSQRNTKKDLFVNIIYIAALILIKSIGVLLFLFGWFFVVQFLEAKRKKNYLQLFIFCFLALMIFGIVIFADNVQIALFDPTFREFDISKITSRRSDLYVLAYDKWIANPWTGSGLGVTDYDVGVKIISTGVHNIVLDFAVHSGIVGVVLYFTAVIKGLRKRYVTHEKMERRGILVAIIILLCYSMIEVIYFHYAGLFFFWMLMGLYNADTGMNY